MPSRSRRKTHHNQKTVQLVTDVKKTQRLHHQHLNNNCCFEGDLLSGFLHSFYREIESESRANKFLPEKVWFKKQFAIGVNEVTRLLERMPPSSDAMRVSMEAEDSLSLLNQQQGHASCAFATTLQAVLLASDCNPRWLTKHLPSLASSRNIPVIYVKDNKDGSRRLGELVKVKTAIAVGVKVNGNSINRLVQRVLHDDQLNGSECLDSVELAAAHD